MQQDEKRMEEYKKYEKIDVQNFVMLHFRRQKTKI